MHDRLQKLAELFLKFPGIGDRQAKRFAFFVLNQPESYIRELASAMEVARGAARRCSECFRLHEGRNDLCDICANPNRELNKLLIVEKQADLESIERTTYNGLFFILGGLVPIVEKRTTAKTRIVELQTRVARDAAKEPLEIILAFPLTSNGDHTDTYVRELLEKQQISNLTVTSLGRGLSMGSELEYIDPQTLEISIKKRE